MPVSQPWQFNICLMNSFAGLPQGRQWQTAGTAYPIRLCAACACTIACLLTHSSNQCLLFGAYPGARTWEGMEPDPDLRRGSLSLTPGAGLWVTVGMQQGCWHNWYVFMWHCPVTSKELVETASQFFTSYLRWDSRVGKCLRTEGKTFCPVFKSMTVQERLGSVNTLCRKILNGIFVSTSWSKSNQSRKAFVRPYHVKLI